MQPQSHKNKEHHKQEFKKTITAKVSGAKAKTNKLMLGRAKKFQALYVSDKTLGEHFAQFFFLS